MDKNEVRRLIAQIRAHHFLIVNFGGRPGVLVSKTTNGIDVYDVLPGEKDKRHYKAAHGYAFMEGFLSDMDGKTTSFMDGSSADKIAKELRGAGNSAPAETGAIGSDNDSL